MHPPPTSLYSSFPGLHDSLLPHWPSQPTCVCHSFTAAKAATQQDFLGATFCRGGGWHQSPHDWDILPLELSACNNRLFSLWLLDLENYLRMMMMIFFEIPLQSMFCMLFNLNAPSFLISHKYYRMCTRRYASDLEPSLH